MGSIVSENAPERMARKKAAEVIFTRHKEHLDTFDSAIKEDVTASLSKYRVASLMPDEPLAEIVEAYNSIYTAPALILTCGTEAPKTVKPSPVKSEKNRDRTSYRIFRLREFKYLRDTFPDVARYYVERSKTDKERICDTEKFMVKFNSAGYYLKKSTLSKCSYFRGLFENESLEMTLGHCQLKAVHGEEFGAILAYLAGDRESYRNCQWIDLITAINYLGFNDMNERVEQMVNAKTVGSMDEAVLALYYIGHCGDKSYPKAFRICMDMLSANLHILVQDPPPYNLITLLSHATLKRLFANETCTYFTRLQQRILLWKWMSNPNNPEKKAFREDIFRIMETPTREELKCAADWRSFEREYGNDPDRGTRTRFLHQCIIVAGGTGPGRMFSSCNKYVRPTKVCQSLMIFNVEANNWHILPSLPVPMLKPLIATNDIDDIYVVDSHALRKEDWILEQCLFCLSFNRQQRWSWSTTRFVAPVGIKRFRLIHFFCVNFKIFLIGVAKTYEEVIRDWDMGEAHRGNRMEILKEAKAEETSVAVLVTLDLSNGKTDVEQFLFHVPDPFNGELNAVVEADNICLETKAAYLIGADPTTQGQIFAVYDCSSGNYHCEPSPLKSFDILVPSPHENGGVIGIKMGSSKFGVESLDSSPWVDMTNISVEWSHPYEEEPTKRKSYMTLACNDVIFLLGGLISKTNQSDNSVSYFEMPSEKKEKLKWKELAPMPRNVVHGGAVFGTFDVQAMTHHEKCPHCAMYPQDNLRADTSRVNPPAGHRWDVTYEYSPYGVY